MPRTLSEHESIALVARYGVPVAEERRSATPDDAVTADPSTLWRRVLRRQGGDLAIVSTFAEDASLN